MVCQLAAAPCSNWNLSKGPEEPRVWEGVKRTGRERAAVTKREMNKPAREDTLSIAEPGWILRVPEAVMEGGRTPSTFPGSDIDPKVAAFPGKRAFS